MNEDQEKAFADAMRDAVREVNELCRRVPDGIAVRFDVLDFSTVRGQSEQINVSITKRI
jgi:hypothetical protein